MVDINGVYGGRPADALNVNHTITRDLIGNTCAYCRLRSASTKEKGRLLNPQFPTHPQLFSLCLKNRRDHAVQRKENCS